MNDYYQQGLTKAQTGDYQGAIEDFELALIANPASALVYYRRGLVYFDLGNHLNAVADYTKSIELQPQQRDAYYARALVRLMLQNYTGALADVEQAIVFGRDYAPAYQLKGTICQKLAQRQQSIEAYKLAASLYLKQQDLTNSRLCLEKAQAWNPPPTSSAPVVQNHSNQSIYSAAIAKAEAGDLWGALQEADSAVKGNLQDAQAYCCRGVIQLMRNNREAALVDFNTAIRLDPQGHTAYRHRGKIRQQLGDWQGALADFAQALQINPQDAQLHVFRAQIQGNLGNHIQAIADLNQAIALNPQEPSVYVERAQAQTKIEEIAAAQADYQTAANLYLDRQDIPNYQQTIAKLQNLQTIQPPRTSPPSATPHGGSADLRQRLLVLVGGQWPMAERLLERFREEYPGYDDDWYLEQVIAYIERGL